MYEDYFDEKESELQSETASTKTLMMFKDHSNQKRSVSSISWNPESTHKIAVAYSNKQAKVD